MKTGCEEVPKDVFAKFCNRKPHTFFVGAAVEKHMATEIWTLLENGIIENAVNLIDDNQIASMS